MEQHEHNEVSIASLTLQIQESEARLEKDSEALGRTVDEFKKGAITKAPRFDAPAPPQPAPSGTMGAASRWPIPVYHNPVERRLRFDSPPAHQQQAPAA